MNKTVLPDQILRVYEDAQGISIHADAIADLAGRFRADETHVPRWDGPEMYQGPSEQVVGWFLLVNAIGFDLASMSGELPWCIEHGDEHYGLDDPLLGLMAVFAHALDAGLPLSDPHWLMDLEQPTLESLLLPPPGHGVLSSMPERLAAIHELGRFYRDLGGPLAFIQETEQSVLNFSQMLVRRCPTWEDSRVIQGHRIRFLERAVRCAAMLYGRFGGVGLGGFRDPQHLRMGADRRIPQVLFSEGILELSPEAAASLVAGETLMEASTTEVEIRAATLHAIELIRDQLEPRFPGIISLQISSQLWRMSLSQPPAIPGIHRVRTISY